MRRRKRKGGTRRALDRRPSDTELDDTSDATFLEHSSSIAERSTKVVLEASEEGREEGGNDDSEKEEEEEGWGRRSENKRELLREVLWLFFRKFGRRYSPRESNEADRMSILLEASF